ncbi:MAG: PilZ domain-containing protein [Actinobacteria bacterium]|nr:MAG: PilZ domain-containing protein [Actinomycetota bacterium]
MRDLKMTERRAASRARVDLQVTLSRGQGRPVHGHTLDVSTGGSRVMTDRPLHVDELLAFELLAIELSGEQAAVVAGQARVLRMQRDTVYALRFERLAEEDAIRLRGLLDASRSLASASSTPAPPNS